MKGRHERYAFSESSFETQSKINIFGCSCQSKKLFSTKDFRHWGMSLKMNVSFILRRGELKLCLQRFQTQRARFRSQNFDKVDNSKVIPVKLRNFNIGAHMKIAFGPNQGQST